MTPSSKGKSGSIQIKNKRNLKTFSKRCTVCNVPVATRVEEGAGGPPKGSNPSMAVMLSSWP